MNNDYLKKESANFIHELNQAKSLPELPDIAPYGFTYGEYLKYFEKYIELSNSLVPCGCKEIAKKVEWLKNELEKNPKLKFKVVVPYTHRAQDARRAQDTRRAQDETQ